jgi:hypothetical protein
MLAERDRLLAEARSEVKEATLDTVGYGFLRLHVIDMEGPMDLEAGTSRLAHTNHRANDRYRQRRMTNVRREPSTSMSSPEPTFRRSGRGSSSVSVLASGRGHADGKLHHEAWLEPLRPIHQHMAREGADAGRRFANQLWGRLPMAGSSSPVEAPRQLRPPMRSCTHQGRAPGSSWHRCRRLRSPPAQWWTISST